MPTTACTLQTTHWRQQEDRETIILGDDRQWETIDKPTNVTNNRPTDIWLTEDGSKRTNHVLQFSQPITPRLNSQMTNNYNTASPSTQDNDLRLTITDDSQFIWLWWWLPLLLSKSLLMPPQTVLLRTTLTRTIILYRYDSLVQTILQWYKWY